MPNTDSSNQLSLAFIAHIMVKIVLFIVNILITIGDAVIAAVKLTIGILVQGIIMLGNTCIYVLKLIRNAFIYVKVHTFDRVARYNPFAHFSLKLKFFSIGVLLTVLAIGYYQFHLFITNLPDPRLIGQINYPVSTEIYDRNGKLLYELYKDQNRTPIHLKDIPAYVYEATIAVEDKDFFQHNGVSIYGGIIRAAKEIIINHSFQGGSTITQQLVKTSLLTPERTIERKIKEIILALWTEQRFSKKQILEMYLNQVPYGGTAYGIEQASRVYFDKGAKDLTLPESAYLAGLPQAPTSYSPYSNPTLARHRRNEVLTKMYEQKYITKKQYDVAVASELAVIPINRTIKAPHFVFYVISLLEKYYGVRRVETGGFRVTTSLDLDVQEKSETILKEEIEKVKNLHVTNGAILVTKPNTGEILAMVGSVDYFSENSGAFNVTTSNRQPGSSIKPLMYSLALSKNYTAASLINDVPIVFTSPGGPFYRPVNYDGRFHGTVPLRIALANSYNIPAVRVLYDVGVSNFVTHAKSMGISTWNNPEKYGLSLTLGGAEVKMTDMAVAYGVFANGGNKMPLHPILNIKDYRGVTLDDPVRLERKSVLSRGVAYIISSILSDNEARRGAFGDHSQLEIPGSSVAVKTGTTNDKHDNWTIGYTPNVLTAVWVGNNDNSPMDQQLTSGITGAAPIWNRVMSLALSTGTNNEFQVPDTIATKMCYGKKLEYFVKGTENSASCRMPSPLPPAGGAPTPPYQTNDTP